MEMLTEFVEDLVSRFQVSPQFVETYFRQQPGLPVAGAKDWQTFAPRLNDLQRMYVQFALTTTRRGSDVYGLLSPYFSDTGTGGNRSYLDIGCGYGGFLRAFSDRGYDVTGIELQSHLAELSRANLAELEGARVYESDFFKAAFLKPESFDCVTCNDVLEHVADPKLAMKRLAELVAPQGVLFLELPNNDCITSVKSDGHHQLFGIASLERDAAARYYSVATGRDNYYRGNGEFYPLDYYTSILEHNGMQVRILKRHLVADIERTPELLSELSSRMATWLGEESRKFDPLLVRKITERVSLFISRAYADYATTFVHGGESNFELKYLTSFWSVVATRTA
jgi:2-polyprenyl-3-methyl-5-hydroxy-6-metoxy-1,4-benzoquinol methylase